MINRLPRSAARMPRAQTRKPFPLILRSAAVVVLASTLSGPLCDANAQGVTTPTDEFGQPLGSDYFLANYQQIAAYWNKLARESDRVVVEEIGTTAHGRPHLMAIVTSPANHRNIERYKEISRRLALAQGLTDEDARELAAAGKAVVWIDGGLHATETLGAQQLAETVYQFASMEDDETLRILDEVIILFVHANPDGNDLVADWYMRNPVPEERSTANLPELYQKYIGHDNNRDFFASTQAETENINRVLYHEWFPQILYNHHQSGPRGTVLWSPPLRDPYNYNLDPLIILGFQSLGAAMHTRLAAEGKGGATMRSGGPYDGWWNGGIRNTAAFHGTIALLTEMIGSPTPMSIPFVAERQVPSSDLAFPAEPGPWHFRQSIDYSVSLNRAVLDYAARMRENLLFNRYVMGRRSIERGSTDTWTPNPRRIASLAGQGGGRGRAGGRAGNATAAGAQSDPVAALRAPELRDPRAYVIPSDQADFPTATKFINALREVGVSVMRATADFSAGGRSYPAGSYVVLSAQAFRPHVLDMFEPQVHPDVFPYPGAPPTPPYDNAGWTLAYQMGIEFDRILDDLDGPFEPITDWNTRAPPGQVSGAESAQGFLMSRRVNDAFIAVNRLLASGAEVFALQAPLDDGGTTWPAGTFYIRAGDAASQTLESSAQDLGVSFQGTTETAPPDARRISVPRIGLWDRYGGSIDSGWARWILEQFEFPYEQVFPQRLDAGNIREDFDVLIFVGGGIPGSGGRGGGPAPADVPEEYRDRVGAVTVETTLPQIRAFMEQGGTVIAIGSSAENLAVHLELPLEDHLTGPTGRLPRTEFFVPGSVVRAHVDTTQPAGWGMAEETDFFFDDSPVFRLGPGASAAGVTAIAWFDSATPLRSGWAWGQEHLESGVVAVEAVIGSGRALLFTPEILKRAQPHGTFKLLFNSIQRNGGE